MNAQEMMTQGAEVPTDAPVSEVARRLLDTGTGGVAVVDGNRAVVGMISATDVVAKHARPHVPLYLGILGYVIPIETRRREEETQRVLAVNASQLMETEFASVSPDADIQDIATLMVDERVDAIPVVQDGTLLGVVSFRELLKLLIVEENDAGGDAT